MLAVGGLWVWISEDTLLTDSFPWPAFRLCFLPAQIRRARVPLVVAPAVSEDTLLTDLLRVARGPGVAAHIFPHGAQLHRNTGAWAPLAGNSLWTRCA